MPTTNPRVQVTLTRATFRALNTLAKRHSRSMSSLAAEVLNDLLPQLSLALETAAALRKLSPAEQEARRRQLDIFAEQAQAHADEAQGRLYELLGSTERGTPRRAGGAQRTRPGKGATPHRTNRGV